MPSVREIEARITGLRDGGSRFSTERMENFARALGNPQDAFRSVHIAGTNGKGSTCALTESILRAHGFKTGMFTSPHLLKINERVQVDRRSISDADFCSEFAELDRVALEVSARNPSMAPTFFEYTAALAFSHFRRERVGWGVIEVGLGGRLDATNVVSPKICAITSIGFDHMQYLGDTLEKIAAEKAGIIKPGVPTVCGAMPDEAFETIAKTARKKGAPLFRLDDIFTRNPQFDTSLGGLYQKRNAALAFLICKTLGDMGEIEFSEAAARDALLGVRWDARWQEFRLSNGARLILDCSHNAEGAAELEKNLEILAGECGGRKPAVAVGVLGRERATPLLKAISKYAGRIIFLKPNEPRALDFWELEECLPERRPPFSNSEVDALFPRPGFCAEAAPGDTIVCTGSCYLAGEILARLTAAKRDNLQDRLPAPK